MPNHAALVAADGTVEKVVVVAELAHAITLFGPGNWVAIDKQVNYPAVGWRWDGTWFWPWGVSGDTLWVNVADWEAVPAEDKFAFVELTQLSPVATPNAYVFGGHPITDENIAALIEVLGP